ncbi:MAG: hypothetical protein IKD20_06095 [Clostridia bacterium]|nr:hypothetical protein [Clostridia bacterium]
MSVFDKSKWIWLSTGEGEDQYAEFRDTLHYLGGEVYIRLSCDSDYTLYINGKYVASNQYGDYEHYKIYDEICLNDYLLIGDNRIDITVYHLGVDTTSRYKLAPAGLIYEVVVDGEVECFSSIETLSRLSPTYRSGACQIISNQLGFTFEYDATSHTDEGYALSREVDKRCTFYPRPIPKQIVKDRCDISSITKLSDTRYLIDFGKQVTGLATLDIYTPISQKLTVAWGQHIADGCVRKVIYEHNFYYTYCATEGRNIFTDYMLRLSGRYLEVESEYPIDIHYIGLLPQEYEVNSIVCHIEDKLDRDIYDICLNSLKLCMMEHYVDTPWREQGLYPFDSVLQMFMGYFAFEGGNRDYVRANLSLMLNDDREDGLLSICTPCGTNLTIPCYSLYFVMAVESYASKYLDRQFAIDALPKMRRILREFDSRYDGKYLHKFEGEMMWNFYDWSEYASGSIFQNDPGIDIVINCLYLMAIDSFVKISDDEIEIARYLFIKDNLISNVRQNFWRESGYSMHLDTDIQTNVANCMAVLSGVATSEQKSVIADGLVEGRYISSSMAFDLFKYVVLMDTDLEKYKTYILDCIRRDYSVMLDAGSDTVWETMLGEKDFDGCGSLCHGWNTSPIYVYHKYGIAKVER